MIENQVFEKIDYAENQILKGEYENCTFVNCVFYNANLSNISFRDCAFNGCDFSLATLKNTVLNEVKFANCKLLGLHFEDSDDFILRVSFEDCILKLSTFYKRKIKKTVFKNCNLQEVDFSECDLTGSLFDHCDLGSAVFYKTVLDNVDFRTSFHYSFDPEINRIKRARFSREGVIGLLDKYNIEIEA
jgi:fluoroquinolone resistance protein